MQSSPAPYQHLLAFLPPLKCDAILDTTDVLHEVALLSAYHHPYRTGELKFWGNSLGTSVFTTELPCVKNAPASTNLPVHTNNTPDTAGHKRRWLARFVLLTFNIRRQLWLRIQISLFPGNAWPLIKNRPWVYATMSANKKKMEKKERTNKKNEWNVAATPAIASTDVEESFFLYFVFVIFCK